MFLELLPLAKNPAFHSKSIVKLSLSLNLSLSLKDRDRADTIITLYHQVWYIIGIVSSSPTQFHVSLSLFFLVSDLIVKSLTLKRSLILLFFQCFCLSKSTDKLYSTRIYFGKSYDNVICIAQPLCLSVYTIDCKLVKWNLIMNYELLTVPLESFLM